MQKYVENGIKIENIEEKTDFILLKEQIFENDFVLVREYIKKVFEKLNVFSDVESKHYEMIVELAKSQVNKELCLPHEVRAKKTYAGVKFMKGKAKANIESSKQFVLGELFVEGFGKIVSTMVSPDEVVYGEGSLFVDYAKISNNAVWRTRKLGDVFSKLGTGSKKLNDYFTDKKIDFEQRDKIPVLALDSQVLVVAKNDVSEYVKIDGETDQIVKIDFFTDWISWQ